VPPDVETNMFHLGTRMPSIHEADAAYLDFDTVKHEPGYPPEPVQCVLCFIPLLPAYLAELMRIHRNYPFAV
jgi:hypothetical protein